MKQHQTQWSYEQVETVLSTDRANDKLISKELGRTIDSIRAVRNLALQFEKGNTGYTSVLLQDHFKKYYTNKGNMQLEPKEETKVEEAPKEESLKGMQAEEASTTTVSETMCECEGKLEKLTQGVDIHLNQIKSHLAEWATLSATHENHKIVQELETLKKENEELKTWKTGSLPKLEELEELQRFAKAAKESNFATMLKKRATQIAA